MSLWAIHTIAMLHFRYLISDLGALVNREKMGLDMVLKLLETAPVTRRPALRWASP